MNGLVYSKGTIYMQTMEPTSAVSKLHVCMVFTVLDKPLGFRNQSNSEMGTFLHNVLG